MSANINDKFVHVKEIWTGQIGAAGVANDSATTVPLSSSTGLPTDTAIYVSIDRVDGNGAATASKKEVIKGVVSGDNLINCTRGVEGTAQAHSAGAVVEYLMTASQWNSLVDGILVGHTQAGAHIASLPLTTPKITTSINDANGNEVFKTPATTNAINEVTVTNSATGNAVQIAATGDDTNISLTLAGKGTGTVTHGTTTRRANVGAITATALNGVGRPSLADGQNAQNVCIYFTVPDDYVSGDVTLKVAMRGEAAVASNTMVANTQLSSWVHGGGQVTIINNAPENITMLASAAGTIVSYTLPAANVGARAYWYTITRLGTNGADNYGADVSVLGAWLEYTGNR